MIACICRNISENKYKDKKALYKRLIQDDKQCCKCLVNYHISDTEKNDIEEPMSTIHSY